MADHAPDGRQGVDEHAPAEAAIEVGRKLFAGPCSFVAGVESAAGLPSVSATEVAFAGRSNVGKSSLINALTGREAMARVSHTPGRTKQLNFFDLGGRLMLVDMPGYGYAKAPKVEVKRWHALIDAYLMGRPTLRRVMLLIDSRHGLKESDRRWMDRLDAKAVSYQAVLTKVDKTDAGELKATRDRIATELAKRPAAHPTILETSARDGSGLAALRAAVAELAPP
jgi:GTP-binding protein